MHTVVSVLQEESNKNNDVWYISRVLFHLPLKPHKLHVALACSVMAHLLNQFLSNKDDREAEGLFLGTCLPYISVLFIGWSLLTVLTKNW